MRTGIVLEATHREDYTAIVRLRGEVEVDDVFAVAKADPLGQLHLAAAQSPNASLGDSLRLLAFYADVRDGRRA